ncbi:MAG TPA: hypothetical protein VF158_16840 [Longimicrobiales bacterium]
MEEATRLLPLDRNPSVDMRMLEEVARVTRELEKVGIEPRPGYNLEPPLGGKFLHPPRIRTGHLQRPAPDVFG